MAFMEYAIEVKNLVKRYRKAVINAVDDVSLGVQEGELFALLGPNGAGKTTMVSILTTTLTKSGGEVRIAGLDLDRDEHRIRRNIGVIFQQPSLDLNLTAEENIRLHASLYGLYTYRPFYSLMPGPYKERVEYLASVLGIKDTMFQPMKTFSGGMKRKLEIVRSLMHEPRVLFLDEPTTGLDPQSRRNLWKYLLEMRRTTSMTIFLTTHYLDEAEGADHVAIINAGKIVSYGTPREVKRDLIDEYLLLDTASSNRPVLVRNLKKLGVSVDENAEPPYRLALGSGKATAQEIISAVSVPLTVLDIHRPTLEDAYLEIIEEKESV